MPLAKSNSLLLQRFFHSLLSPLITSKGFFFAIKRVYRHLYRPNSRVANSLWEEAAPTLLPWTLISPRPELFIPLVLLRVALDCVGGTDSAVA